MTTKYNHNSMMLSSPPSTPKRPHLKSPRTPDPQHDEALLPPCESQRPRAIINLPNLGMVEAIYVNESPRPLAATHTPKRAKSGVFQSFTDHVECMLNSP
jgi:hypothetical protein